MEYLRTFSEDEKLQLTNIYTQVKDQLLLAKGNEVYWLNLYLNQQHLINLPSSFHSWIQQLVHNNYSYKHEILSYGFIVNPAHSTVNQQFHYDYTKTSSNLFIPITQVTTLNATQYLTTKLKQTKVDDYCNFGDLEKVMESEQVDAIIVSQLICKPFSLIKLKPNVPHRGIANHDNYDRIVFFITVDEYYHDLTETIIFKECKETI